jgi:hypothetical protein
MNICPNVYEHLSMDKFFVERTINNLDSILETSSIFAINNSNSVRRTNFFSSEQSITRIVFAGPISFRANNQ